MIACREASLLVTKDKQSRKRMASHPDEVLRKINLMSGNDFPPPQLGDATSGSHRNTPDKEYSCPHKGPVDDDCHGENDCAFRDVSAYLPDFDSQRWEAGVHYTLLEGRLFFSWHPDDAFTLSAIRRDKSLFYFSSVLPERYIPFCADWGPTNISLAVRFCRELRQKWNHPKLQTRPLIYYCSEQHVTNTALNLAIYLMLEHNMTPEEAIRPFNRIYPCPLQGFRDATWCAPSYTLDVLSCLKGLRKAIDQQFLASCPPEKFVDCFDCERYEYCDEPSNLNLNQITPKFIAFVGPKDRYKTRDFGAYDHEPSEFIEEFNHRSVSTIVRLNDATTYNKKEFTKHGFEHKDIYFDDCTVPPPQVIEEFLNVCDAAAGTIAIHCLAGLGRTGTLIAIWLMKNCEFTAREAMGFLRLVRPGSIIGPQQQFLEVMERCTWNGNEMTLNKADAARMSKGDDKWSKASSRAMAEQVASAVKVHRGAHSFVRSL